MIFNIQITDKAIEYLAEMTEADKETAGEIGQNFLSLCHIEETETGKKRRENKLLTDIRALLDRYKDDPDFDLFVRPHAHNLEAALDQFFETPEKRPIDRRGLFDILVDVWNKAGIVVGVPYLRIASDQVTEILRYLEGNNLPEERGKNE